MLGRAFTKDEDNKGASIVMISHEPLQRRFRRRTRHPWSQDFAQ
jgi:hypothetical protein